MALRFHPIMAIASIVFGFTDCLATADDFSQFRGPSGSGVVRDQKIPLQWSSEMNMAWKITVPGAGWSQPVIWNQLLFVTNAVSDTEMRPKIFQAECGCRKAWEWGDWQDHPAIANDSIYFRGIDGLYCVRNP